MSSLPPRCGVYRRRAPSAFAACLPRPCRRSRACRRTSSRATTGRPTSSARSAPSAMRSSCARRAATAARASPRRWNGEPGRCCGASGSSAFITRHEPLQGGGTANPVHAVARPDRAPSPLGRHRASAPDCAASLSLSRRGVRARRRLEEEAPRPRPPPLVRYITSHYIELRYITLHRTVRRRRRFVVVAVGSSLARHRVCVPLSPPTPHPSVRAPPRLSANRNPFPPSTTRQRGVERDFVAAAEPPHARTPSPARVQSPPPPCWRDPPPPGAARAAPR